VEADLVFSNQPVMLFSYLEVLETSGSEGLYGKRVLNGKAALLKYKRNRGGGLQRLLPVPIETASGKVYIIRFSLGLGVRPGIRPRLAMGRPSISLRSPLKSTGLAPLM